MVLHVVKMVSTELGIGSGAAMVKDSVERDDSGRILRLVLVAVWILALSLYSVLFARDSEPYSDILIPPDKQHQDGMLDRNSTSMHFDVAERDSNSSAKIVWKCFLTPMRLLEAHDLNAPARFQQMTQSENADVRFENYSGPTKVGEAISQFVPLRWLPQLNAKLNIFLIAIAIGMLLLLAYSYSQDAESRRQYLWIVTAAGMAFIIIVPSDIHIFAGRASGFPNWLHFQHRAGVLACACTQHVGHQHDDTKNRVLGVARTPGCFECGGRDSGQGRI